MQQESGLDQPSPPATCPAARARDPRCFIAAFDLLFMISESELQKVLRHYSP